jgi:hypothetical protein
MNEKTKAAVIGGVLLGVLSAIPFVNLPNICCCAWAILGGAFATYTWIKKSPTPVSVGDGALLGVIAGAIGGIIYLILGVPMALILGNTMAAVITNIMASADPQQAEMVKAQMAASQNIGSAIISGFIGAVMLAIFSTLGGLIAVPIFEKRKGGPGVPPPPQNYGGPQGGTYNAPQGYGPPPGGGYGS